MKIEKKFKHWDIKLPSPEWNSDLARKVIDLEKLRDKRLVPESIDLFMELKLIFQTLENWASARIEGNQTRLLDALYNQANYDEEGSKQAIDKDELENLRKAIDYVEDYCKDHEQISVSFILDLHKMVVNGLPSGIDQPGDRTPGKFRTGEVEITKSDHVPPLGIKVSEYMNELVNFANENHSIQNFLLVAAVFHHRFTWVHPFNNGNGRVVRLMTYAMLQLMGYGVTKNRILNPTAIFFADRSRYYMLLSGADTGSNKGILDWADYFIGGLIEEIDKIDRLLDKDYILDSILYPVLKQAHDTKRLSDDEYTILRWSLQQPSFTFVSGDINIALGTEKTPLERSRIIKRMRELEIITVAWRSKQRYVIELWSPNFTIFLVDVLKKEGFVESDQPAAS
ncbi:MAG: Fic family protein [Candidatus Microsaccharimonas sp.]